MKKTITLSLVTLITLAVIAAGAWLAQPAHAAAQTSDARRAAFIKSLPADVVVPAELPAAIQDPMLLEAWIRLYNQTQPVQLWDGSQISGRVLAQFALVAGLPVVWDVNGVCGGGSCSPHSCVAGQDVCDFEVDGQPGNDPIYIKPMAQPYGQGMVDLVSTLAHEIYHRTQPFGAVHDTRFEEYWAYFVGEKVSGAKTITFGAYNPRDAGHLNLWIKVNRLDGYYSLAEYPARVAASISAANAASASANTTDNFSGVPAQAYGAGAANSAP
ncbi:MAG: hypothetical protein ABI847_15120 [Anaerolineales bacterium]